MQGVGERPEAAFARGIPVNRLRYVYTMLGGALAGIGGAAFSLDVKLGWRDGLTRNYRLDRARHRDLRRMEPGSRGRSAPTCSAALR